MNQTELLLANARDDIDRRLIEFGHDPRRVDNFASLSARERLKRTSRLSRWVSEVRQRNAARLE